MTRITADLLLSAYAAGVFPMAESREDPTIHWIDPRQRGIFPMPEAPVPQSSSQHRPDQGFHISRSLRRSLLHGGFHASADRDFTGVVTGCAERPQTWINAEIFELYQQLHRMGHAHSIEIWREDRLVGGLYGVTLGAAFFGESMFSRVTDASKVALAHTMHRLRAGGFILFDTQFLTAHLASLGAIEIPRQDYRRRLAKALSIKAHFNPPGYSADSSSVAGSSSPVSGAS
jgi:leucyl/phenylalanyl-tRNA--protein transferase